MTTEELKNNLKEIDEWYKEQYGILNRRVLFARKSALNKWANENAEFKIGDIIKSQEAIIEITAIRGDIGRAAEPFVIYAGPVLTKKLERRSDGWETSIYADCPERNIVKIK